MDACYAAGVSEGARDIGLVESPHKKLAEGRGRIVIASAQPNQRSWEDPELATSGEPSFCSPASIEVETVGGERVRAVQAVARGHPDRPATRRDLETKFRECAEPVLEAEAVRRVIDRLSRLEELPSVRDLTRELTAPTERAPIGEPR